MDDKMKNIQRSRNNSKVPPVRRGKERKQLHPPLEVQLLVEIGHRVPTHTRT